MGELNTKRNNQVRAMGFIVSSNDALDEKDARGLPEALRAVLRALTDEDARLYLKARKSPQKSFLGAS